MSTFVLNIFSSGFCLTMGKTHLYLVKWDLDVSLGYQMQKNLCRTFTPFQLDGHYQSFLRFY